jgi:hypothetical protein
MITQIEGYLLIPHELLHVLGYRLVGKHCIYRWGDHQVKPVGPLSRNERLVGLLFPFVVCMAIWLIMLSLLLVAFFYGGLAWAMILSILSGIVLIYAFAAIGDLRQTYLLLHNKKHYAQTPFDFLFWPVQGVKGHTSGLRRSALIILICLVVFYALYLLLYY